VPFTLKNLRGDVADLGSNFEGPPDLGDNPQDDVEGRRDWWSG
jgi:hypothetical protein